MHAPRLRRTCACMQLRFASPAPHPPASRRGMQRRNESPRLRGGEAHVGQSSDAEVGGRLLGRVAPRASAGAASRGALLATSRSALPLVDASLHVLAAEDLLGVQAAVRPAADAQVRGLIATAEGPRLDVIGSSSVRDGQRAPPSATKVHCSPSRSKISRRVARAMRPGFVGRWMRGVLDVLPSRSFSSLPRSKSTARSTTTARSPLGARCRRRSRTRSSLASSAALASKCMRRWGSRSTAVTCASLAHAVAMAAPAWAADAEAAETVAGRSGNEAWALAAAFRRAASCCS